MYFDLVCYVIFCYAPFIIINLYYFNSDLNLNESEWNIYKSYYFDELIWNKWGAAMLMSSINLLQNIYIYAIILIFIPDLFENNMNNQSRTIMIIMNCIIYEVIAEIYFYCVHKLLHNIEYLKIIHIDHHKNLQIIAASVFECHPFEHLILNIGTLYMPIFIMYLHNIKITQFIFYIANIIFILNACKSHSGYIIDGEHYYIHHKYILTNFGFGLYIIDKIAGTYYSANN